MLATFIGIYLLLGLPAAFFVWMVLKASKGREGRTQDQKNDRSNYKQFQEQRTETNSVRS